MNEQSGKLLRRFQNARVYRRLMLFKQDMPISGAITVLPLMFIHPERTLFPLPNRVISFSNERRKHLIDRLARTLIEAKPPKRSVFIAYLPAVLNSQQGRHIIMVDNGEHAHSLWRKMQKIGRNFRALQRLFLKQRKVLCKAVRTPPKLCITMRFPTPPSSLSKQLISVLAILLALAACEESGVDSEELGPGLESVVLTLELSDNLSSGDNEESDPFVIEDVVLNDELLTVLVGFSGGCEPHSFKGTVDGAQRLSTNPVLSILLSHQANDDECEMWIRQSLTADISVVYPDQDVSNLVVTVVNASNTNQVSSANNVDLIIDDDRYNDALENRNADAVDAFELVSVDVTDDVLTVKTSVSGGCAVHDYQFFRRVNDVASSSNPVELTTLLRHEDNDDPCDSIFEDEVQVNFDALFGDLSLTGPVRVRVLNGSSDEELTSMVFTPGTRVQSGKPVQKSTDTN